MINKRRLFFRLIAVLLLVVIAIAMFIVGRGHTVYVDNKTIEANGETYKAFNRVNVFVNGERLAKLAAKERGKATNIGQDFTMTIEVIREKGGETETYENLRFKLPYNWDGIVINIPAYLENLPHDIWMTEFVAAQTTKEEDTEEIVTDEFALGDF